MLLFGSFTELTCGETSLVQKPPQSTESPVQDPRQFLCQGLAQCLVLLTIGDGHVDRHQDQPPPHAPRLVGEPGHRVGGEGGQCKWCYYGTTPLCDNETLFQAGVGIHFNFGIHDRNTPPAQYEERLEKIVARLRKTGAKLVWASTTPIPKDEAKKQTPESIVERNAVAARVMQKHGIAVDDLFAFITPHLATAQNPNDVHFNAKGYELLGGQVAEAVLASLKTDKR